MSLNIDYDLLADKIAERLKPVSVENQLWDSQACADYLRITRQHFTDIVSKRPGFPSPCGPASETGPKKRKRWHKDNIIQWANPAK